MIIEIKNIDDLPLKTLFRARSVPPEDDATVAYKYTPPTGLRGYPPKPIYFTEIKEDCYALHNN